MQTVFFSFALAAAAYASTDLVATPTSTSYELSATVRQCHDAADKVLRCTCDRLVKDGIPVPLCCMGERFVDPSACRRMLHDDRLYATAIWSKCEADMVPGTCQAATALFHILEQDRNGTRAVLDELKIIGADHTRGLEDILRVVTGLVDKKIETALAANAATTHEARQEMYGLMRSFTQQFNATSLFHTGVIRSEIAAVHHAVHSEAESVRTDVKQLMTERRTADKVAADARNAADILAQARHAEQIKAAQECADNTSRFAAFTLLLAAHSWWLTPLTIVAVGMIVATRVIYGFVAAVRCLLDPASYRPKAVEPLVPKQPAAMPVPPQPAAQPAQGQPRASFTPSKDVVPVISFVPSAVARDSHRAAKARRTSPLAEAQPRRTSPRKPAPVVRKGA